MRALDPAGQAWTVRVVWRPRWAALSTRLGGWRRRKRRVRLDHAADGWDLVEAGGGARGLLPAGRGGHGGSGGGSRGGNGEGGWWGGLDEGAAVVAVIGLLLIGLVASAALFWWLLLPLVLLLVDAVVVLVLLVGSVAARVFLRRPWTVEAVNRTGRYRRQVVGLRAARRARRTLAGQLRSGALRPPVPAPGPGR
ncbi:hypothetical protein [Motilibacter aurantiacus]|uniref:hypothetical protein n=1 Tax=Motilibacter aurantiacus TaxID=2714955 RepID=UPI00140BCCF3|nr:hypothetical protein [Motilibacter aurantiacus]NHC45704.1 hypothetical protein [Motilibacter aurantiacus]